jgi:MioC protein
MLARTVGIFTATTTGLAELCAEEVEAALAKAGFRVTRQLMDGLAAGALEAVDIVVIISSTYGHGDIPDNGQAFYNALNVGGSLDDKLFAVFGLGDRTYADTFCRAGESWDALLAGKGAIRLAPLERHDASAGTLAEDEAGAWSQRWAAVLEAVA